MNFIHIGGGWRGKGINWDPTEPVLPGGYDQRIRERAETDTLDMISRLQSLIVENTEDLSLDDDHESDSEGYMDNGVRREEE
jgi:helicase MOV-10